MNLRLPSDQAFADGLAKAWPAIDEVLKNREAPAKITRETWLYLKRKAENAADKNIRNRIGLYLYEDK